MKDYNIKTDPTITATNILKKAGLGEDIEKTLEGLKDGQAKYITQGLDLKGGVSITYQVSKDDRDKLNSDSLEATRGKLEKRIHTFSTEATAYKQGNPGCI